MYNLPRQNGQESGNINRPITSNEIETVIENLPTKKKVQDQMASHGKFYQTFRGELKFTLLF